tara:strand:- start:159 stop:731 length:573 start_codon:yes stop_codon:yes gene_type:complete
MSATNAPFGMRPSFHPSGLDRAVALPNGIASAYSSGILKGQPVALNTSGNIIAATAGSAYQGAFAGHEYTDLTGRRQISNQWIASTSYTTGSEITYYYSDPLIVYDIQCDGSLAQTSIGDQANFSNATAGSTSTGLSQCTISSSLAGSGAVGDLRIIGLTPAVDNAWGDAYTVVQVQVSRSQYVATINAF